MNARTNRLSALFSLVLVAATTAPVSLEAAPRGRDVDVDSNSRFSELTTRAQREGQVPVIIQLAVEDDAIAASAKSEDRPGLSRRAEARQRRQRNIARVQDIVSDKLGAVGRGLKRFRHVPFAAMAADEQLLEELAAMPEVLDVQEDSVNFADLSSSVPVIGANDAHDLGWNGLGQAVAILDTGVDTDHPMLVNNVIAEAAGCFSATSDYWYEVLDPATSLCSAAVPECTDSNGNAIHDSACGIGAAEPCASGCNHGTHVAGIAAGNGGQIGVAPQAAIIPVQVFVKYDYDEDGDLDLVAYDSDIIAGLEYVLDLSDSYNIAAVNMSFGGGVDTTTAGCDRSNAAIKAIIDDLRAVGIASVIAAGNDASSNGISSPGCISTAVSVGSTTDADVISSFSNESPALTLHAPGSSITSSVPGTGTQTWNGTSMATPHVVGAMALLKQKAADLGVDISVDNMVSALQQTGAEMTGGEYQVPRIQVDAALDEIDATPPITIVVDNELHTGQVQVLSGAATQVSDVHAYGGTALQGETAASNALRFTPNIQQDGNYRVSVIWPTLTDASSAIDVSVVSADGVDVQLIDQTKTAGLWQELGVYTFNADELSYVQLSDAAGGRLAADAVKFDWVGAAMVEIVTQSLPHAIVATPYQAQLEAVGGKVPYIWSISSGALPSGLTLDPVTGAITGSPAAEGQHDFTALVSETGGILDAAPLSITVEPYTGELLDAGFDNGSLGDWTLVDEGPRQGPSNWSVIGGELQQWSNIYSSASDLGGSLGELGTYAVYEGGYGWSDYRVSLDLRSEDNDVVGLMFRVVDASHYYRLTWNAQGSVRRLVKRSGSSFTVLGEQAVGYVPGQSYRLEVTAVGDLLTVWIDGQVVFSVSDPSYAAGSIALHSNGNQGAVFDNVLVEDLGGTNQAPVITSVTASPQSLLDTEHASLAVVATDPDGDNSQLAYAWNILSGGGSLDNASLASPQYTPADVTTPTQVRVQVQVTDADGASRTGEVTLSVDDADASAALLDEIFSSPVLGDWTLVDEGPRQGPSNWSVIGGELQQWSNIYSSASDLGGSLGELGTYAVYEGGYGWSDYRVSLDLRSEDNDVVGLMFRVVDASHYYRLTWNAQGSVRRLVKRSGSSFTVLGEQAVGYVPGQSYRLEVTAVGDLLTVWIDGQVVFSVSDPSYAAGSIALHSNGNQGAVFDNVLVEDLGGTNQAPVITSVTASPQSLLDTEHASLAVVATDPDGDNSQLAYAWNILSGGGSLDNASLASPQYTPADVTTPTQVRVQVQVTDADGASRTGEVTLSVDDADASAALLDEIFSSPVLGDWTLVDEGPRQGPSNWSVIGGELQQWSNIYSSASDLGGSLGELGTYAVYEGGYGWSDYRVSLDLRSEDNDVVGLMFRVVDASHYYRLTWNAQGSVRRLVKRSGSSFTVLGEQAVGYVPGQSYRLEVTAVGDLLTVWIDGQVVFSVSDPSYAAGSIALHSNGNQGAVFDNVLVEELQAP